LCFKLYVSQKSLKEKLSYFSPNMILESAADDMLNVNKIEYNKTVFITLILSLLF